MMPLTLALLGTASAQVVTDGTPPDLNAQTFRPTIDGRGLLVLDDGSMPTRGGTFRALFSYHDDLLIYTPDGGETQQRLVGNVVQTDLIGGLGIGPFRLGLNAPIYLLANGDTTQGQTGLGDLAIDGKIAVFGENAPVDLPIDLALQARVALPTATVDLPLGSQGPLWRVSLAGSKQIGRTLLAANLGTVGLPAVDVENGDLDDAFEYRLGGSYAVAEDAGLSLELAGLLFYGVSNRVGQPLEALLGGYWEPAEHWTIRGGVGRGLTNGFGSPDVRVILGLGFQPDAAMKKTVVEPVAEAPARLDTDGDGIPDDQDQCVDVAEDLDGVMDSDGCPDEPRISVVVVDADGNPVPGAQVRMEGPMDAEQSFVGSTREAALAPGVWTVTAEADTYLPTTMQVELTDGNTEEVRLELPVDPDARVVMRGGRIDLKETVQFKTSSDTILDVSTPMLDEVVRIMSAHPEIEQVTVEGHTDSRGNDAFNLDLSQRRAASVRAFLLAGGIAPERVTSEGYGETRPLDPAETPEAWAMNRRVELRVTQWAEGTAPSDP